MNRDNFSQLGLLGVTHPWDILCSGRQLLIPGLHKLFAQFRYSTIWNFNTLDVEERLGWGSCGDRSKDAPGVHVGSLYGVKKEFRNANTFNVNKVGLEKGLWGTESLPTNLYSSAIW